MIAKRKKNVVEPMRFVACLAGYEDFNYVPQMTYGTWFARSKDDYKTLKEWKKQRLKKG